MHPRRSSTTHTEHLGDEASVYDWERSQVHALNPTAARVWRLCDGATSADAIAAALRAEMGISDADAVVDLTLNQLARVHLLEAWTESPSDLPVTTRRWLLGRGLTAAMLPVVYTILAPSAVEAQSPGGPTLTSVAPNQGTQGTTVPVTLTGTNFVVGATTVNISGTGVTVNTVAVVSATSLTALFTLDAAAAVGARTVTVTTAGGTSGGQTFTINAPAPSVPTLTSVAPNQGIRGTTVAVTLTGTNFVVGATTVNISGVGVTVNTIVVGGATSLTANFVLDLAAAVGDRTVTVTTAAGTSGGQTFTIVVPPPGSQPFAFTGASEPFTVPPGVTTLTVTARGAQGGSGGIGTNGGRGGSVTATLTVVPGTVLNVRVGGQGGNQAGALGSGLGGFNGGGAGGALLLAGGGGGASDIRSGGDALSNRVIVAGGGGGGGTPGTGGAGGGTTGAAGANSTSPTVTGGGGGTPSTGGSGGVNPGNTSFNGLPGAEGTGGTGGASLVIGGGGGGGGYYGGGGGAVVSAQSSGGAGGGGSSFAPAGAVHTPGDRLGNGEVIINW